MDLNVTETMKNIVAKGIQTEVNSQFSGTGYITEKLYMLLQLYIQNKGWNPSIELLQCFTELKESSVLPNATYLQMLASRVTLDSQGRLILRENGKIILPFEHFANAVMLKHMNGPHGLHLSLEATIRAVIESYTIGRDNFGMEKEFIMEVVQNCPSAACRYYKAQLDLTQSHNKPTYIPEVQPPVPPSTLVAASVVHTSSSPTVSVDTVVNNMAPPSQPFLSNSTPTRSPSRPPSVDLTPVFESVNSNNKTSHSSSNSPSPINSAPLPPPSPKLPPKPLTPRQQQQNKLADFLKANLENLDNMSNVNKEGNNDSYWSDDGKRQDVGQEKIIRAFSEIMKNMNRMKSCVRPAMCKPYGKQSEALQKTVIDTIQLVQSLRSFLPPPHIAVSSWKNEDKHGRLKVNSSSSTNTIVNVSSSTNSNVLVNSNIPINVEDSNEIIRNSKT
ncbi:hypothetical protein PGB90_005590 [Kerria lacca]